MANLIVNVKKAQKWLYPFTIEKVYRQYLSNMIDVWKEEINKSILPRLPAWVTEEKINRRLQGRADLWTEDINSVMSDVYLTIGKRSEAYLNDKLKSMAGSTNSFNEDQFHGVVKSVLGIDIVKSNPWLKDQINKWVDENTGLIRQLNTETLNRVQNIVSDGVAQGRRVETIADRLINEGKIKAIGASPFDTSVSAIGKARNRAKLIADDQIGKLNSQLTERRQEDLGFRRYRWRNVGDKRVRGNPIGFYPDATYDHWAREGQIYKWDKPPEDGHPGYAIRCRCWADPVFEDIIDYGESNNNRIVLKSADRVQHDISTPLTIDVAEMFRGKTTPNEIIDVMQKHPAIGFINKVSFNNTVSIKDTLQFGLFRMRMGNLLRGAIKKSGIPVKVVSVKKIAPIAAVKKESKRVYVSGRISDIKDDLLQPQGEEFTFGGFVDKQFTKEETIKFLEKQIDNAVKAIDETNKMPKMLRYKLRVTNTKFRGEIDIIKRQISLNPLLMEKGTLTHELGHALDFALNTEHKSLTNTLAYKTSELKIAIDKTKRVQDIAKAAKYKLGKYLGIDVTYLNRDDEKFARAYTQFVFTKALRVSKNPEVRSMAGDVVNSIRKLGTQWKEDDFESVYSAFEKFFKTLKLDI